MQERRATLFGPPQNTTTYTESFDIRVNDYPLRSTSDTLDDDEKAKRRRVLAEMLIRGETVIIGSNEPECASETPAASQTSSAAEELNHENTLFSFTDL